MCNAIEGGEELSAPLPNERKLKPVINSKQAQRKIHIPSY